MRVLEVITGGEEGGAQRHLRDLANGLAILGDSVLVAHGGGTWLDTVVTVPTVHLPELGRSVRPVSDIKALRRLMAVVNDFQPDVIHGHSSKGGFLARIVGQLRGRPVVFTAHGLVVLDPTRPPASRVLFRWLESWAARQSQAVIAVSQRDRDLALAMGAPRALFIPNGVVVPEAAWESPHNDPQVVGFLARFSREKGFEVLADAVRRARTAVRVRVAGQGDLDSEYRALAVRTGVPFEFLGWQDDPVSFFRTIDVLAIPSWKEGLPYTLLDALAFGVPVVVTDVGAMGDVVRQLDPDLVVPPGRPDALLASMERALDAGTLFTDRARSLVRDQFTVDSMVQRTREVLVAASGA